MSGRHRWVRRCTCGHPRVVQAHHRPGSNCGACSCPSYRRACRGAAVPQVKPLMARRLRVTPRDRQSGPHAPAPVLTVTGELLAELETLCPDRSRWRLVHSPAAIDATAVIANRPVRSP